MTTKDKFNIFKQLTNSDLPNNYLEKLKTEAIINKEYELASQIRDEQIKIQSEDWIRKNK